MTAIKQKAICTPQHMKNVAAYLDDERALARASQNLANEKDWAKEMDATREAYGHNAPGKQGAKCTYAFHQVLAFNPDECSCNGGKMTPEACMEYARQYVAGRYGAHEAVWVLHREHCAFDGTDRFAVHIAINRTNLETGKRLNEGRSRNAKIERANTVRDMDAKWRLAQMREGERNCRVHAQQPTKRELAIAERGARSDKQYIREAIAASVPEARACGEANKVRALAKSLDVKGVEMHVGRDGKGLVFERRSTHRKVRGYKLGRGYSMAGIAKGLGIQAAMLTVRSMEEGMER